MSAPQGATRRTQNNGGHPARRHQVLQGSGTLLLLAGERGHRILLRNAGRQLLAALRQWLLGGLLPVNRRTQHGRITQRALHCNSVRPSLPASR